MTTDILNSRAIQYKKFTKADLIHLQSICTDNKALSIPRKENLNCALGDREWDLFGGGRDGKRSQLTERLTAAQLRELETSRLACFHGICSKPLLHLDPGNCIHLD